MEKFLQKLFEEMLKENSNNMLNNSIFTILFVLLGLYFLHRVYQKGIPYVKKISEYKDKKRKSEKQITDINKKLDVLADDISALTNILNEHIEESKLDTQASMKAQLMQIFHDVHKKGYIIECDAETFNDVLKRYENAKGNGHIHSVVKPYITEMSKNHLFQSECEAQAYKKEHGHY